MKTFKQLKESLTENHEVVHEEKKEKEDKKFCKLCQKPETRD